MPTIAEIIAAKKAAAEGNGSTVSPAQSATAKKETLSERVELKEAIDRIDPPGKRERSAAAQKATGMILNRNMPCASPNGEARGQATPITTEPEERSLSATEGEAIPVIPVDSDEQEKTWHAAMNAFESELCLMTDPKDPERGWIAVRLNGQEDHPILLKSFMLYPHPRTVRSEPF
jgi:hypothetical protein